ncbi:uncharacterized protein [Drosophila bipectinata]|uniref:uncharacterized protein n=1 Tax=Drosophila bipectinata TaxID=42026 RepID=UPI001C896ECD|nr:uncharacterized protein LOC108119144 [Drosophila bipectinata]
MVVARKKKPAVKKKSLGISKKSEKNAAPSAPLVAAKQRIVVTPWRDTQEFNATYDWLFAKGSTPANRRQALSQMRIWSLRRGNLCPAAVLATSVLVQAQLEDKMGNPSIQTTYANAFTRFYNFMSSIIQGHNMSSMYETAKELGLQSFIVDLRHLCAHGQELPPVSVLRNTSKHCLEWLRTYYWVRHKEYMVNLVSGKLQRNDKLKFEKEITRLLEIYDLSLECQLQGAQKLKDISKLKSSAEFNKIRVYASNKKVKTAKEILNAVLGELNVLIKKNSHAMKDLLDIYLSCLLKMKYFLTVGLNIKDNEDEIVAATQELFRLLAMQGFIEKFFTALVQMNENANEADEKRLGAGYWALKMIETFTMLSRMKRMYKEELDLNPNLKPVNFSSLNTNVLPNTLKRLLVHSGVDSSVTLVFGDNPKKARNWIFDFDFIRQRIRPFSKFSGAIVKGLLSLTDPPLDEQQIEDLTRLCNIRLQEQDSVKPKKVKKLPNPNYSLNDLQNLVASSNNEGNNGIISTEGSDYGIWKLDNEHDWSTCALGVVP